MREKFLTNRGFTLVEMLIAILVFVIFLTATSGSYLSIARSIYNANQERKVYSAAQDILNMITREIKDGVVDYDCYEAMSEVEMRELAAANSNNLMERVISNPNTVVSDQDMYCYNNGLKGDRDLVIRSKEGDTRFIIVFESGDDDKVGKIKISRQVRHEKLNDWVFDESFARQNYSYIDLPENIKVKDLKFRITPGKNPYKNTENVKFQFQPQVTVLLEMESSLAGRDDYSLPIQTTISSRVYNKLSDL